MCCLLMEIELGEEGSNWKGWEQTRVLWEKEERVLREKEEIMIMNLECSEEKYVI